MLIRTLFFICSLYFVSGKRKIDPSVGYKASVVEFSPVSLVTSQENSISAFIDNANEYKALIAKASSQGSNIVVFPECGLRTLGAGGDITTFQYFSEFKVGENPCKSKTGFQGLQTLSCAAKDNMIYVVVNLPEKANCSTEPKRKCPPHKFFIYNTNVVFGIDGQIIARYRKYNLFGETNYTTPEKAEIATFDTNFGVKFGLITCFDIMFNEPAVQLVQKYGIRDIIFPTAWFSEIPFLTAVQIQRGWAQSLEVNLLASGYNNPSGGSSGSGIFSHIEEGQEETHIMPGSKDTRMLTQMLKTINSSRIPTVEIKEEVVKGRNSVAMPKVPILDEAHAYQGLKLLPDKLNPYTSQLINDTLTVTTVCSGEFCCLFEVEYEIEDSKRKDYYRMVVYEGVRSFAGIRKGGLQVCALIFCNNESLSSCVQPPIQQPYRPSTTFSYIKISGVFNSANELHIPNTLTSDHSVGDNVLNVLSSRDDYSFSTHPLPYSVYKNKKFVAIDSKRPFKIFTFGIYGRDFSKDDSVPQDSSASNHLLSSVLTITCSLVLASYYIMRVAQ